MAKTKKQERTAKFYNNRNCQVKKSTRKSNTWKLFPSRRYPVDSDHLPHLVSAKQSKTKVTTHTHTLSDELGCCAKTLTRRVTLPSGLRPFYLYALGWSLSLMAGALEDLEGVGGGELTFFLQSPPPSCGFRSLARWIEYIARRANTFHREGDCCSFGRPAVYIYR